MVSGRLACHRTGAKCRDPGKVHPEAYQFVGQFYQCNFRSIINLWVN